MRRTAACHLGPSSPATSITRRKLNRILGNRPDAIVTDEPAYEFVNREALAALNAALGRYYLHVHAEKTGAARWRHVYRIRPEFARWPGIDAIAR